MTTGGAQQKDADALRQAADAAYLKETKLDVAIADLVRHLTLCSDVALQ